MTGLKTQRPKEVKSQVGAWKLQAGLGDTHSRRTVLDPCSSHLLFIDNVHQLNGVCALHVHHRPLEWVFRALVQLKEERALVKRPAYFKQQERTEDVAEWSQALVSSPSTMHTCPAQKGSEKRAGGKAH
jgi:hypothetical protein